MESKKNNFLVYKDWKDVINLLNDDQAGKLFKSLFDYVEDRTEIQTEDGMLLMAFTQIKITLERDLKKYKEQVEKNRINGAKGGRPKNNPNGIDKNPNNPSGLLDNPKKPKKADRDIDRERDNGNVKDKVNESYYENTELNETFIEFLKIRKKIKAVNSEVAIKKLINKISHLTDKQKIECIDNSIMNSYKGLFPDKFSIRKQEPKEERIFGNG